MKSVEMSCEAYEGIPADLDAFTPADQAEWFDTKDIHCLPAVLAAMKGLRGLVAVTAVSVEPDVLSMKVGSTARLSVAFTPSHGERAITWTSSAPLVVSVTSGGEVRALNTGAATITASDGTNSDTCAVTVA